MAGVVNATGADSPAAKSKGKLCGFLSCITSNKRTHSRVFEVFEQRTIAVSFMNNAG